MRTKTEQSPFIEQRTYRLPGEYHDRYDTAYSPQEHKAFMWLGTAILLTVVGVTVIALAVYRNL